MSDKEKYERLQQEIDNHHKAMKQCLGILADTLKANKEQIKFLEEKSLSRYNGLQLAIEQLEDAKQMLIECGKTDWADTLDTSIDYYIARGKLMAEENNTYCYNKECDYSKDNTCTFNEGKNIDKCRWHKKENKNG